MSKQSSNASGGIGFFGLLAILFIALKLLKIISWSWWVVLSPLYAPATILLIVFIFITFISNRR